MIKQNNSNNQQQLLQNVQMDGSVNFQANGDINIYPCPWELDSDKQATRSGGRVRYQAGIEVDSDGRTRVKRHNIGTRGPLYETLFETAHGAVKMTRPMYQNKDYGKGRYRRLDREYVYVTFKFPKKHPLELIKYLYRTEADEIEAFLKTRKTDTLWNEQSMEN